MELQKCDKCKEYYYGDVCLQCAPESSTNWTKLDIRE